MFGNFVRKERRLGFTLAEVLVTLGIIGVIAAMTLPTLIKDYQKSVIEARLKWFYSAINQAVRMSVVDNGSAEYWEFGNAETLGGGLYEYNKKWAEKYLLPYLKHEEVFECPSSTNQPVMCIRLQNGSLMTVLIDANGGDIGYYPDGKYLLNATYLKDKFLFQFHKKRSETDDTFESLNSVEAYSYKWDNDPNKLKSGHAWSCYDGIGIFCTKLLQLNNWKFPKDWPW